MSPCPFPMTITITPQAPPISKNINQPTINSIQTVVDLERDGLHQTIPVHNMPNELCSKIKCGFVTSERVELKYIFRRFSFRV